MKTTALIAAAAGVISLGSITATALNQEGGSSEEEIGPASGSSSPDAYSCDSPSDADGCATSEVVTPSPFELPPGVSMEDVPRCDFSATPTPSLTGAACDARGMGSTLPKRYAPVLSCWVRADPCAVMQSLAETTGRLLRAPLPACATPASRTSTRTGNLRTPDRASAASAPNLCPLPDASEALKPNQFFQPRHGLLAAPPK